MATSTNTLRVAIFQGGEAPDVENNLATLEKVVAAHKGKVDLFVFPELYLGGYVAASDFHKYAEQSDGPSFQRIAAAARENSVAIAYGYVERDATDPTILYNSAQLVSKQGNSLINYRKTHLWSDYENKYFTAGTSLSPVVELENGFKAALLICFDVEYPEVCRCLALEGANILICPTALANKQMTTITVISRALENHCFLVYANLVGSHSSADGSLQVLYCGNSVIVGPDGLELARGSEDSQEVVMAELDLNKDEYKKAVDRNNYMQVRRPELYGRIMNK